MAIGITKSDADIEEDFYEFVDNNMPYSIEIIRCIGHEPNTEGYKYYYTKEELKELINEFPYIYRSKHIEIVDSKCLLDFPRVLTYQKEEENNFFGVGKHVTGVDFVIEQYLD